MCLVEAAAALQAARQRDLTTPTAEEIVANERKRCEAQSGSDRKDCLKRVAGVDTTVTGSVASGGDLRETVTVIPGVASPGAKPGAGPASLPPKPSN